MDIERYKIVATNRRQIFDSKKLSPHIPQPNEMDYKRGYITRYFIQKANDTESPVYELDYLGYRKFFEHPFTTAISLDWKIKGTDEEIKDANLKSIKLHYKKIPKLMIYLPNLLQFKEKKDLAI